MITVDGNLPEQEIRDAMKFHGMTVVEPKVEPKPAVEVPDTTSEPAGEPGDEVPAGPEGTSAATTEEAEETTREEPSAPAPAAPNKSKAKGGYQAKIEKQTRVIEDLERRLDAERGDRSRLEKKLEEAEQERQRLHGKSAEEPAEPAALVRPKRPVMPDLADFDFDQDKYREALKTYHTSMDAYDDDMEKFHKEVAEQMTAKALEDRTAADEKARVEQANVKFYNDFVARKDRDAEELGERLEAVREAETSKELVWDEHPQIMASIMESDIPGHLMVYFYEHPEEIERIDGLVNHLGQPDLRKQVAQIALIENRLEGSKGKSPAAPAKKAEAETPPVKPKPKAETPDAPINPVGSRTTSGPKDYHALLKTAADAGDSREYQRLRAEMQKVKAAAVRTR